MVSRGTGVGKGRGEGELALSSRRFEYLDANADWLIFNQAMTLCSLGRACLHAHWPDNFIGVKLLKTFKYCSNEKFSFRDLMLLKLGYRWVIC